jgi:hypothetical protein
MSKKEKQSKSKLNQLPSTAIQLEGLRKLKFHILDKDYDTYDELKTELERNPLLAIVPIQVTVPAGLILVKDGKEEYHSVERCENCDGPHVINILTDNEDMTFKQAIINPKVKMIYDLDFHNEIVGQHGRLDLLKHHKEEKEEETDINKPVDTDEFIDFLKSKKDPLSMLLATILSSGEDQNRNHQN